MDFDLVARTFEQLGEPSYRVKQVWKWVAGGATSYEPNTRGEWQEQPDFREPPLSLEGAADHWNHRVDEDYYSQPGALFRLMSRAQQQVLCDNTARALQGVSQPIVDLHVEHCRLADPAYGQGVADAIRRDKRKG